MEPWMEVMWAIIVGLIGGIIAALIGYGKGTTVDKFNPYKLVLTLIIGAIVGGYAGYQGIDILVPGKFEELYKLLYDSGVIFVINFIVLLIWRRSGLAAKYGDGEEEPVPNPPDPDVEAAIDETTPRPPK